jgi:hypothetical protein
MAETKTLFSLSEAVAEFFGGTGIKVSSLRTEARKGNLELTRIAGRDYVSREAIGRMIERCRTRKSPHDCGSGSARGESPSGPSVSERAKQAQAALKVICEELKKPSPAGLRRTKGPTPQNVVSIKSR